jgi:hypothetical protein
MTSDEREEKLTMRRENRRRHRREGTEGGASDTDRRAQEDRVTQFV